MRPECAECGEEIKHGEMYHRDGVMVCERCAKKIDYYKHLFDE